MYRSSTDHPHNCCNHSTFGPLETECRRVKPMRTVQRCCERQSQKALVRGTSESGMGYDWRPDNIRECCEAPCVNKNTGSGYRQHAVPSSTAYRQHGVRSTTAYRQPSSTINRQPSTTVYRQHGDDNKTKGCDCRNKCPCPVEPPKPRCEVTTVCSRPYSKHCPYDSMSCMIGSVCQEGSTAIDIVETENALRYDMAYEVMPDMVILQHYM